MATTGLLAHVLVAKYADHLALYLLKAIFGRASVKLARSMLAEWVGTCGVHLQPLVDTLRQTIPVHRVVHADETPVQILQLGTKKPHRACLWTYAPGAFESLKAVIYDFTESRAGEHARAFLGDWQGSLLCDDDSGYKASFIHGITEIGSWRMRGESSSSCMPRANWPSRLCIISVSSLSRRLNTLSALFADDFRSDGRAKECGRRQFLGGWIAVGGLICRSNDTKPT